MVFGLAPTSLLDLLPDRVHVRTSHNLRNRNDIDIPPSRINAHKYSFLPSTVQDWNNLDKKVKEAPSINAFKNALVKYREKPPPHYYEGSRRTNAYHCRMRIGCSALKSDLCNELKVIPSSACACGGGAETAIHYLYDCPIYANPRTEMMENLYKIGKFNINTLLYGDSSLNHEMNSKFFACVHKFMEDTKRFG
jgi:hypothetical protein